MAPEPGYRLRLEAATLPNALVQHSVRLGSCRRTGPPPTQCGARSARAFVQANLAMRQLVETKSYGSDFTVFAAPSLAVFPTLGGLEFRLQLIVSNNEMITIFVDAF